MKGYRSVTHIRWQDDGRWRLVQIRNMKRLALHAQIYRLQWIQSHLHLRRLLRRLRRLRSHVHLLELVGHALHALLSGRLISLLRRLVAILGSTILRLPILWLLLLGLSVRRLLHSWVAVLRLLLHTI